MTQIESTPRRGAPIQVIEDGVPVRLNDQAIIPDPPNRYFGFSIELERSLRMERRSHTYAPYPLLFFRNSGYIKTDVQSGCRRYSYEGLPGSAVLIPAEFEATQLEFQHCEEGGFSGMLLEFHPAVLGALFEDEFSSLELDGVQSVKDKNIAALVSLIEAEVLQGCWSGKLYADCVSIALVEYLARHYAGRKVCSSRRHKLSRDAIRKLTEYVKENIQNDLSVAELAQVVHLSPYHFSRLFKAAMSITPHRFVMECRLQEVKKLLGSGMSIGEVASLAGFGSQGYMATAFRKRFGVSPTHARHPEG